MCVWVLFDNANLFVFICSIFISAHKKWWQCAIKSHIWYIKTGICIYITICAHVCVYWTPPSVYACVCKAGRYLYSHFHCIKFTFASSKQLLLSECIFTDLFSHTHTYTYIHTYIYGITACWQGLWRAWLRFCAYTIHVCINASIYSF